MNRFASRAQEELYLKVGVKYPLWEDCEGRSNLGLGHWSHKYLQSWTCLWGELDFIQRRWSPTLCLQLLHFLLRHFSFFFAPLLWTITVGESNILASITCPLLPGHGQLPFLLGVQTLIHKDMLMFNSSFMCTGTKMQFQKCLFRIVIQLHF